ncbi:MAG: ABC transporter permease [Planctomycetota bacterium]
MSSVLYLAWRYLAYHRVKTAVLVMSIALIAFVPAGLRVLVGQSERQLTARAVASPLLMGARGSPLELVLNSLYFSSDVPDTVPFGAVQEIADTGLAQAIPLHVRFRFREHPIVGTSLDYFDFRRLRIAEGGQLTRLGDCVVGAAVARRAGVGPGDHVVSSPENVFDLAGVYPLKMRVTGVLAATDTPDDQAVFVDLKTAWIIEGLAHGHDDLARPEAAAGVLRQEGNVITANASVVQHNEVTDDNVDTFHFHGRQATFPITAILAVPPDHKAATILRGRYESSEQPVQIVRPVDVMDELLGTVLSVQRFVVAALLVVALATVATAVLVFALSLRLRKREVATMVKIGGTRGRIVGVLATEIGLVLIVSASLAIGLTAMTGAFASDIIQAWFLR